MTVDEYISSLPISEQNKINSEANDAIEYVLYILSINDRKTVSEVEDNSGSSSYVDRGEVLAIDVDYDEPLIDTYRGITVTANIFRKLKTFNTGIPSDDYLEAENFVKLFDANVFHSTGLSNFEMDGGTIYPV